MPNPAAIHQRVTEKMEVLHWSISSAIWPVYGQGEHRSPSSTAFGSTTMAR